ncbi:MAG: TIGR02996 domain-containing protein [Archangium sp.]|nr:TIGR02996 domain-containing protein [Archangium sp.]MDP3574934.1 TIGR02996 domain-containing protein [Archangium sp.]
MTSPLQRASVLQAPSDQLPELLRAWQDLRHPRIADLVDRVSARLLEKQKPIRGKTVPDRVQAVVAVCATNDPLEVGRVLASEWPGTWQHALPMLKAIIALPDDPRVARELARQLDANRYYVATAWNFYFPLLQRINELGDVRQHALLAAQRGRTKSYYADSETRALEEAAARPQLRLVNPPLSVEDLAALELLEAPYAGERSREKTTRKTAEELLEDIYENPTDLGARAVYGDWLTENGDPRGELIALQLGAPSEKSQRKQDALIKKHWKQWLGPIADLFVQAPIFEAGFPVVGRLETSLRWREDDALIRLLSHRAWCTIRTIDAVWDSDDELLAFVKHPNLKSLREVGGVSPSSLPLLAAAKAPLSTIRLDRGEPLPFARFARFARFAPGALKGLAKLERLSMRASVLDRVAAGLVPLVELEVEIEGPLHTRWPWLEAMPVQELKLRRFEGVVQLKRAQPGGPFTIAHLLSPERVDLLLRELPTTITSVISDGVPRAAVPKQALARLLQRFPALARGELPFFEEIQRPQFEQVTLWLTGMALLDEAKLAPLWKIFTEGFGIEFDSCDAHDEVELELGAEPVVKLATWANDKRCRKLFLKLRGTKSEFSLHRDRMAYTNACLPLVDSARFFSALEALVEFAQPLYLRVVRGRQTVTIEHMSEFPAQREALGALLGG